MSYENRWRPLRELGHGGQGVVHLATDLKKVNIDAELAAMRQAINALRAITTVEESRRSALLLAGSLGLYLKHDAPEMCGALKVLHPEARSDKARARMEHEVKALNDQNDPHIVKIVDAPCARAGS